MILYYDQGHVITGIARLALKLHLKSRFPLLGVEGAVLPNLLELKMPRICSRDAGAVRTWRMKFTPDNQFVKIRSVSHLFLIKHTAENYIEDVLCKDTFLFLKEVVSTA